MRRYCTLEDVRRYTGIPVERLNELGVDRLIERASAKIEAMTGLVFEAVQATEVHDGSWRYNFYRNAVEDLPYLVVEKGPVISVDSLTVDGTPVTPDTLRVKGRIIYLTDDSEVKTFGHKPGSVQITYTYGVTDESIKALVNQLCVVMTCLEMLNSPEGANAFLEYSNFVEYSAGDVRPQVLPRELQARLVAEANQILSLLPRKLEVF